MTAAAAGAAAAVADPEMGMVIEDLEKLSPPMLDPESEPDE